MVKVLVDLAAKMTSCSTKGYTGDSLKLGPGIVWRHAFTAIAYVITKGDMRGEVNHGDLLRAWPA